MTSKFHTYPENKPSGIEWLGEIPSHWILSKYKYHSTSRMGQTILKEEMVETGIPIYSATQDDGILGYVKNPDLILKRNDLVIPARGNSIGYVTKVDFDRATCTQTTICSYNFSKINIDYLLFCCRAFKDIWFLFDHTAIPQITVNQVENNLLPLPPMEEQEAIAAYLDDLTGKVDALIAEKLNQVEDLRSYRTSLITETVTRGLNPDAPLRPSGIDWLGDIPGHWETLKLKYLVDLKSGSNITSDDLIKNGFPVYGGNGLRGYYSEYNLEGNYILIGRQGALCGNINYAHGRFWATEHAVVCHPLHDFEYKWLGELLRIMNLNQYSLASAQPGLSVERIKNLQIPLPPLTEQRAIAEFLDEKTEKIDALIGELEKQLEELAEYKKSVISEAVTGKVDVRDWKPQN
ncbi:MAG: restriction endonuclease subunit S [Bacteroides sp.]|nr:restriction endonuclease subunit S [Bacteroides sp.]